MRWHLARRSSTLDQRTGPGPASAPRESAPSPPAARPAIVGRSAPPVRGLTPGGQPVTVDPATPVVLLAFLTSSCLPCRVFWGGLPAEWDGGPVVIVTPDPATEDRAAVARLARPGRPVVMSSACWAAYQVRGSSTFVVVRGGRVERAGLAEGPEELARLLGANATER